MRVWIYPEKEYAELGAVRWEVEWQTLTKGARKRQDADPDYEVDYDTDLTNWYQTFTTEQAAQEYAQRVVNKGETFFGSATVTKQVVDWYVEEDRVAEWANVGDPQYVD